MWLQDRAFEAATYYASLFPGSRVLSDADALVVNCELAGLPVMLLNGGDFYTQTPAFSFYVDCEDQAEVDALWDRLIGDGGEASRCGWLSDRFGVSWQIIPKALPLLLGADDEAAAKRTFDAMMTMTKIDVAALEAAAHG